MASPNVLRGRRPLAEGARVFLAACVACAGAGTADAQSCAAPQPLPQGGSTSADTCVGIREADTLCAGAFDNPGPNTVFSFFLSVPYHGEFQLASHTIGFVPVMYLSSSAEPCDIAACVASGGIGTPLPVDGLAVGAYRLIVGAASDSPPGSCGVFTLSYDLTAQEPIFADGFDAS